MNFLRPRISSMKVSKYSRIFRKRRKNFWKISSGKTSQLLKYGRFSWKSWKLDEMWEPKTSWPETQIDERGVRIRGRKFDNFGPLSQPGMLIWTQPENFRSDRVPGLSVSIAWRVGLGCVRVIKFLPINALNFQLEFSKPNSFRDRFRHLPMQMPASLPLSLSRFPSHIANVRSG